MEQTGEGKCKDSTESEFAPQPSTAVAVSFNEPHRQRVEDTAAYNSLPPPDSLKNVRPGCWREGFCSQLRAEVSKIFHLQMDCGLYGSDWRLVYGGSSLVSFGPCTLLLLRGVVSIGHLVALIFANCFRELLFFTTWTNLMASAGFFLSTIISIAAVRSISRQERLAEGPRGSYPCAYAAPRGTIVSLINSADVGYRQLMKEAAERGCHKSISENLSLRRCCDFRRPFSGSPRQPALEALLCLHDIAVGLALPMVTVMFLVYWTMLFPAATPKKLLATVYLHLCCPVLTWVLALLARVPYRLSVLPISIVLGAFYALVVATAQSFGFGFVYWFLDFHTRPALACGIVAGLTLVLNPAAGCLAFLALYRNHCAVVPAHH